MAIRFFVETKVQTIAEKRGHDFTVGRNFFTVGNFRSKKGLLRPGFFWLKRPFSSSRQSCFAGFTFPAQALFPSMWRVAHQPPRLV